MLVINLIGASDVFIQEIYLDLLRHNYRTHVLPFEFDINSIKDDEDNLLMLANLRQKLRLLEPVSDCIIMKKPLCTLFGHDNTINDLISETWASYPDEFNVCVNFDGANFFTDYIAIKEAPDLKTYTVKQILKKMKEINKCN